MIWSPQQDAALVAVQRWLDNESGPQVFRIFGFAGTGKTTLAQHFGASVPGLVLYGACTGKAAYVLRQRGCPDASTIHSMIYHHRERGRAHLRGLEQMLVELRGELRAQYLEQHDPTMIDEEVEGNKRVVEIKNQISEERDSLSQPTFILNPDSQVEHASLVVIDECFVGSTLIDTPFGPKRINTLKPGDLVLNAFGVDRVRATRKKKETQIAKIQCGKTLFYCSRAHPFYTDQGVKSAEQLRPGDNLLRTIEAMRLLWEGVYSESVLGTLLRSEMQHDVGNEYSRIKSKDFQRGPRTKFRFGQEEVVGFGSSKSRSGEETIRRIKTFHSPRGSRQDKQDAERHRTQTFDQGREWKRSNSTTETYAGTVGRWLEGGICCTNRPTSQGRTSVALQDRYCSPYEDDSNRSGRTFALLGEKSGEGQKKNELSGFSRVDSVEILEQGHSELDRFKDPDGSFYLYDLTVEQHPSFSVNGCLVHNCSMVDGKMGEDLLSFGKKVLVLGDPAQLPPVYGAGFFDGVEPDVMLTEIHRQARDNPIVAMATQVREGKTLDLGAYGESRVTESINKADALGADQILAGRNKTRRSTNRRVRELLGRTEKLPVQGDRLVCLRNNHDRGLLNGAIWHVEDTGFEDEERIYMTLRSDVDGDFLEVEAHTHYFLGAEEKLPWWERKEAEEFDFGNCLTVHKAQGSQWDDVLLFDESYCFRKDKYRWLYTGLTRASVRATVVRM